MMRDVYSLNEAALTACFLRLLRGHRKRLIIIISGLFSLFLFVQTQIFSPPHPAPPISKNLPRLMIKAHKWRKKQTNNNNKEKQEKKIIRQRTNKQS